jgi:ABC-2 type transport system permease protein
MTTLKNNTPTEALGLNTKTTIKASMVYFNQCLQAVLLYRSALVIFVLSEAFAYAGFITFWYKAAQSNPDQTIYLPSQLIFYFAVSMFYHSIQHHTASRDLASDIRLGKLSYSIIRPYPFMLQALLRSTAASLVHICLLSPILVFAFFVTPSLWDQVSNNYSVQLATMSIAATGIALICGWLVRLLVGLLAFDMAQIWGPDTFFIALYYAASGAIYPIDLLPAWALAVVKWTPMYYMVGFPTLTIMGRITYENFQQECLRGLIVIAIMSTSMFLMWRRGLHKFEAIGI